jgi:hypothetical protein
MAGSEELVPRFDPELLQVRWVLGGLSAEELAKQALSALELGFEGTALQQLAGLTKPTLSDLGTLPERAFADMGLNPVNREQAVAFLVAHGELFTNDTISSILTAFPAFSERWVKHLESWSGEPAGPYNDMAEFVHFVVEDLYDKGKLDEVRNVFLFMEQLVASGDQKTRDLIGFGFFETLQNVASWQPYGNKAFEQFLGSTSARIWSEIQAMWVGKSSLPDVIRAERKHD